MDVKIIIACLIGYFALLYVVSLLTSRKADNKTYFTGNRSSPWYVVAFGMIGASLSGITFISVPGWVDNQQFAYMQMILGYLPGYMVIAFVLMPLYYRLNLTTIYTYLDTRFGPRAYKTGAAFFLLSRLLGSALRMYVVVNVLQLVLFDQLGVPFFVTVIASFALIWLYTYRAGIKTIVWTDTLQTASMLLAVGSTVYIISNQMGWGFGEMVEQVRASQYSQIFFFDDINDPKSFWKMFISGALIAIVMTGLDQDMMQKNLTCRNIKEAQRNMVSFSIVLVFINLLFLSLGALLYIYAREMQIEIPAKGDDLYGFLATQGHLPVAVGVFFIIGLVAAAYSSADSAITALTTSFCVDILDIEKKEENRQVITRKYVQVLFSVLSLLIIIGFRELHKDSLINAVFRVASYTYGPLLGLFAFGLMTKWKVFDKWTPLVAVLPPILCYFIDFNSEQWLNGYKFGYELLLLNGMLTFVGLLLIARRRKAENDG